MKRVIGLKKTHLFFLLFLPISLPSFNFSFAQTLDHAIKHYGNDELDEAKRILLNHLAQDVHDPKVLFYLGKVEDEGDLSRKYLEDMTSYFPDWINSDEAELLICKYEFCKGEYVITVNLTERFEQNFPQSQMIPEVLWISGCSFLAMHQPDSALLQFDKIIELFPGSMWAGWAQLGRGDCFFAGEDYNQAMAEYNKVLDSYEDSETFPFALSGLVRCFSQLEDREKALLYHNLLKEKYPHSMESNENIAE
jgi:tetratricopeptide (TPR) repeat protein